MTLAIAFWIFMILFLVFGTWSAWPNVQGAGGNLILFILLLILGWAEFGSPIK